MSGQIKLTIIFQLSGFFLPSELFSVSAPSTVSFPAFTYRNKKLDPLCATPGPTGSTQAPQRRSTQIWGRINCCREGEHNQREDESVDINLWNSQFFKQTNGTSHHPSSKIFPPKIILSQEIRAITHFKTPILPI